jgi:hypothetical protein
VIDPQASERAICRIEEKGVQLGERGAIVELIRIVQYLKACYRWIDLALPRPPAISRMHDEAEPSLPDAFFQSVAVARIVVVSMGLDIDEKHVAFALSAFDPRKQKNAISPTLLARGNGIRIVVIGYQQKGQAMAERGARQFIV